MRSSFDSFLRTRRENSRAARNRRRRSAERFRRERDREEEHELRARRRRLERAEESERRSWHRSHSRSRSTRRRPALSPPSPSSSPLPRRLFRERQGEGSTIRARSPPSSLGPLARRRTPRAPVPRGRSPPPSVLPRVPTPPQPELAPLPGERRSGLGRGRGISGITGDSSRTGPRSRLFNRRSAASSLPRPSSPPPRYGSERRPPPRYTFTGSSDTLVGSDGATSRLRRGTRTGTRLTGGLGSNRSRSRSRIRRYTRCGSPLPGRGRGRGRGETSGYEGYFYDSDDRDDDALHFDFEGRYEGLRGSYSRASFPVTGRLFGRDTSPIGRYSELGSGLLGRREGSLRYGSPLRSYSPPRRYTTPTSAGGSYSWTTSDDCDCSLIDIGTFSLGDDDWDFD